jgi:5-formyltetrahydrofolate cyclo-ligase
MEEVREAKKALRRKVRAINQALTGSYKRWASERICSKVTALPAYQQADTVFCFVGMDPEPDTRGIIEDALARGKRVCVPLCIDDHTMVAKEIHGYDELVEGMYGILEPPAEMRSVDREEIGFGVIPCVTCDLAGNRLGHGKGYYDRYLEGMRFPQAMLCYEKVTVPEGEIPVGPYDLPVETVITDA